MNRRVMAAIVALLAVCVAIGAALLLRRTGDAGEQSFGLGGSSQLNVERDTAAMAPAGERVRIRVLNGAGISGLARRGTQHLRDYGYDVVDYGNASGDAERTYVEVSAESERVGARVARALGVEDVRRADKPLAHVDVIVVLGSDWQPTSQPFRP